jgi:ribosomal protein S18 acetylase RimI-like enzyme
MEGFENENKEDLPAVVETISAEDLQEIIYKGTSLPQDDRFLPIESGGAFKYFFVNDLNNSFGGEKNYQIVKVGDIIVGISELEKDPYKENNYWIKFISIDPRYQGRGYAKALAEEMVSFVKNRGGSLEHSEFSDEGKEKIWGLVDSEAEKSGVTIVNPTQRNDPQP